MVRFLGLVGFVIAILLSLAAANFFGTIAAIVIFVYLGLIGLIRIPIGHKGVSLFFGGRLLVAVEDGQQEALFELPEGLNWLPPWPFMGAEPVDVREQPINVTEFTVISRNAVRLTVRPSVIRYRIKNPGQSLSVGAETIRTGSSELLQNIIRFRVTGMSDEEARQATNDFREEIQRKADERAADWGVDVTEILIGEIALPDSVQQAYELLIREEKQREAERLELGHVADEVTKMTNRLYSAGFPKERAAERASEIVERERGKAAISEQRIALTPETVEVLGPVLKAVLGKQIRSKGGSDESNR